MKLNKYLIFLNCFLSIIYLESCKLVKSTENEQNKLIQLEHSTTCIIDEKLENIEKVKRTLKEIISSSDYDDLDEIIDWYLIKKNENINLVHRLSAKLEEISRIYYTQLNELEENKHLEFLYIKDEIYANINALENKYKFLKLSNEPSFDNIIQHDYSFEKYSKIYEATFYSKFFSETIKEIATRNNISSKYFPLLEDFDPIEKQISFMHKDTHEIQSVHLLENEQVNKILKFKNYLDENISNLKPFSTVAQNKNIQLLNVHGTQGLTAAIVIQTLFDVYERSSINNNYELNNNLSNYIKAHTYVNLAMVGQQVVDEITQTTLLVKALTNQAANASNLMTNIHKVSSTANLILNSVNIGLSITELAKSETSAERIQFGTQLGFDSAGMALGISNIILYKAKALTLSASVGALAVPLAGLAIGFNGFATASAQAVTECEELADRFNNYKNDFNIVGTNREIKTTFLHYTEIKPINNFAYKDFSYTEDQNGKLIQNATNHDIVINELDFTQQNKVKINFGTHYLYETAEWKSYGGLIFNNPVLMPFGEDPRAIKNKDHAISLNEAYAFNENKEIEFSPDSPIILPMVPKSYISYHYNYTPGVIGNYSHKFNALREIQEKNYKFMFTYFRPHPIEYAIRSMHFDFQPTVITLNLGDDNYSFFTPYFPKDWKNKIEYQFNSGNGNYYVKISDNAKYSINSNGNEKWFIDAQDINNNFLIEKSGIKLGNTIVKFQENKYPKELIIVSSNGIYRTINLYTGAAKIISIDFSNPEVKNNLFNLIKTNINYNIQSTGYIEIENYNNIKNNKAWFEIDNNKIISPNPIENSSKKYAYYTKLNQNLVIVGKDLNFYYFYNPIRKELYSISYKENAEVYNDPLALVDVNISDINYQNNTVFYKTKDNIGIALNENNPKIISIKLSENNITLLKEIATERNYEISNEVLFFDDNDTFTGWYLKEKDSFVSKDLKNEETFKEKMSRFFSAITG